MSPRHNVYLECGVRQTFAGALDWPGWCRRGPNEAAALAALLAAGRQYASILARTRLGFVAPSDLGQLVVIERLPGTTATDFGVPAAAPTQDRDRACSPAEVERLTRILRAAWRAFDRTVESASGKTLTTGPRGGGRSVDAIVAHVAQAEQAYLAAVGWKRSKPRTSAEPAATRDAILAAVKASAAGEIPTTGPRGGVRWTARYFARRVAWHVTAHTWEIQRRATAPRPK